MLDTGGTCTFLLHFVAVVECDSAVLFMQYIIYVFFNLCHLQILVQLGYKYLHAI